MCRALVNVKFDSSVPVIKAMITENLLSTALKIARDSFKYTHEEEVPQLLLETAFKLGEETAISTIDRIYNKGRLNSPGEGLWMARYLEDKECPKLAIKVHNISFFIVIYRCFSWPVNLVL